MRNIAKRVIFFLEQVNKLLWHRISVTLLVRYLSRYDYISFDMFDTLVFRRCGKPERIFQLIEERYGWIGFANKRISAEQRARKYAFNGEVSYEDIYQNLKEYNYKNEVLMEKENIYANPFMLSVFKELIKKKKRIFIISDMYFSSDILKDILRCSGYIGCESVYVSNELKINKHCGELQRYVKMCHSKDGKCIHIGDNFLSDFIGSRRAGWDAIWYSH